MSKARLFEWVDTLAEYGNQPKSPYWLRYVTISPGGVIQNGSRPPALWGRTCMWIPSVH
jgi:hypothetical protein